jgi:hypothetical protein
LSLFNSSEDFSIDALDEHLKEASFDNDIHDLQGMCSGIEKELHIEPREYFYEWLGE